MSVLPSPIAAKPPSWPRSTAYTLGLALRGIDSDNGSEFLNAHLFRYCQEQQITFTRSRPYKQNDQAHVEQKNWSVVRRWIGYARYEGPHATQVMNAFYECLRLYVNFFQPSLKLVRKTRQGAKLTRVHDKAQTPYQRLLTSGSLDIQSAQMPLYR